jgi:hypothetical protein
MLEEYAECRLGYKMLIAMKLFEISIIAIRDVLKLPYAKKEECAAPLCQDAKWFLTSIPFLKFQPT